MSYNFDWRGTISMEQYDSMPKAVREAVANAEEYVHLNEVFMALMVASEGEVLNRLKQGRYT